MTQASVCRSVKGVFSDPALRINAKICGKVVVYHIFRPFFWSSLNSDFRNFNVFSLFLFLMGAKLSNVTFLKSQTSLFYLNGPHKVMLYFFLEILGI